jgi:ABC-type branched-subunit amino acid transport system permease subunit
LQWVLVRTRFGSRLRAAVDDRGVASGLGLDVNRIFLATFVVGSGLAGLGGALGAEVLGLDPSFPLKFMIYFLIVCAVGGTTTITGPLLAALLLGIADVLGKYYVPKLGAFIVYALMILILLVRPQGLFARAGATRVSGTAAAALAHDARWRGWELATLGGAAGGVAAAAGPGADLQRDRHPGAVRALARPDPRLRRRGFARPRRLLRPRCLHRGPLRQARDARPVARHGGAVGATALLGFLTSFLILRGSDLTRLMVTLGVALILYELANKLDWLTGGADGLQGVVMGPVLTPFGAFEFDLGGRVACAYSMVLLVACLLCVRRIVHSPFGFSLQALRDNALRAASIGLSVHGRLVVAYTIGGAIGGIAGALLAQTNGFASLDVLDFHRSAEVLLVLVIGGHRLSLRRPVRRRRLQAAARPALGLDAAVLELLDRRVPGRARDRRPDRLLRPVVMVAAMSEAKPCSKRAASSSASAASCPRTRSRSRSGVAPATP